MDLRTTTDFKSLKQTNNLIIDEIHDYLAVDGCSLLHDNYYEILWPDGTITVNKIVIEQVQNYNPTKLVHIPYIEITLNGTKTMVSLRKNPSTCSEPIKVKMKVL